MKPSVLRFFPCIHFHGKTQGNESWLIIPSNWHPATVSVSSYKSVSAPVLSVAAAPRRKGSCHGVVLTLAPLKNGELFISPLTNDPMILRTQPIFIYVNAKDNSTLLLYLFFSNRGRLKYPHEHDTPPCFQGFLHWSQGWQWDKNVTEVEKREGEKK